MSAAEKTERSLVRKLAEVKGAIDRIAKNGHNDHFGYDFATESDITSAVRKEMADRHLIMFPNVTNTAWEKVPRKNGETKLCTLTVEFTVEDGDSGETRKFTILGQGEDSMDKATYKAMTGAEKYALLKLFMIPTGDDPERDGANRYTPARNDAPSHVRATGESKAFTATPGAEPIRDKSTTVKFGKTKGKYLCDIPDEDLSWQLSAAKKSADANDPKWGKSNKEWLATVQAETVRRLGMGAPTPAPPAPTGNWMRIVELGALYGKTEAQMKSFCKSVLAGKKSVGPDDVRAVQEALGAMGKPLGEGELPMYPGME